MNQRPTPPPQVSSLRLRRQQIVHNLRLIASLQARIEELENENAQLTLLIAAQAREISDLRLSARPLAVAAPPRQTTSS